MLKVRGSSTSERIADRNVTENNSTAHAQTPAITGIHFNGDSDAISKILSVDFCGNVNINSGCSSETMKEC